MHRYALHRIRDTRGKQQVSTSHPRGGGERARGNEMHEPPAVRVQLAPSLDKSTVDYDASRLMKKDVEAELARHGVPVRIAAAA